MAYCAGHAVLISGLPAGAATGGLLDALLAAGHRPLAVGAPADGALQGRRYVIFQNAAEADAACRPHGALRGLGQAIAVTRLFGAGQGPADGHAGTSAGAPTSSPPTLSARREAAAQPPASAPTGPSGVADTGAVADGRAVLVRGLRIGAHPGHILDTFAGAGLRPEVVRTTDGAVARGRCVITFRGHADAARAVELSGTLRLGTQALRISLVDSEAGAGTGLDDHSSDEGRPPRPEIPWSEAAARRGAAATYGRVPLSA